MDRPDQAPADEGLVPWFTGRSKMPRSTGFDGATQLTVRLRRSRELETHAEPEPEIKAEICACVGRLASTLKEEYADALQVIDVEGTRVKTFAQQRGLSASNAGVRIFRAREALKKRLVESCGTCAEHGCQNCTCQTRC